MSRDEDDALSKYLISESKSPNRFRPGMIPEIELRKSKAFSFSRNVSRFRFDSSFDAFPRTLLHIIRSLFLSSRRDLERRQASYVLALTPVGGDAIPSALVSFAPGTHPGAVGGDPA